MQKEHPAPRQILNRHEGAAAAEREAILRAAVDTGAPAAGDQRLERLGRQAGAQRRAQVEAARRV